MSDIIRLLPDSVANQIAAGEVIQRPASVIKELAENALDAESTRVDILVTDAGKTAIEVIDDGKGMSETDARLAFERHATSKIREAADLFALRTMGFRGEALASIAAVAQVELRTRQESDELGTLLVIAASRVESQDVVSCPKGSRFSVKNLFYNVPARRKFLKSNPTELSNILTEFERIALVNPEASFTLRHNDTELFNLPAAPLRQRIMGVFGKKINQELLPLEATTTLVRVSGFVGRPETARKKGAKQYFFVNGRYMRHPYFHKAVMEAYDKLVPTGEQVSYFIYFEVDPARIDVNIHPTKTEVKFENESAIWQIVVAAVKEALGKFNAVPSIDFDTEGMPDIPVYEPTPATSFRPPRTFCNPDYNPFDTSSAPASRSMRARDWEPLYAGLERETPPSSVEKATPDESRTQETSMTAGTGDLYASSEEAATGGNPTRHFQFKGRFILTSVKSGLMVIEQQRAHVCILYERYLNQLTRRQGVSQRKLFPDIVRFPLSDVPILEEIKDDLVSLGFDLTDLGGGSYAVDGVPADIEGLNTVELIQDLVHTAREKGTKVTDEVRRALALTLARKAAIVPGQYLSAEEMTGLVDGLFALAEPHYTPDGKTVLTVIGEDEFENLFK